MTTPRPRDTSLLRYRALLAMAATLYPFWGLVERRAVPTAELAMSGRFALSLAAFAVLAASFASAWVRRRLEGFVLVLAMVLAAHRAYLVVVNQLEVHCAMAYIISIVVMSGVFVSQRATLVICIWASLLALAPQQNGPHLDRLFFFCAVAVGSMIMYFVTHDRFRLLKDLAASRALLTESQDIARIGGWRLNVGEAGTWLSDGALALTELPRAATWRDVLALFPGDGRERLVACVRAARTKGEPFDLEERMATATGRAIWVRVMGRAEVHRDRTLAVVGSCQDITDRKRAELEVVEQKELLAQLLDNIPLGVYAKDAGTDLRYVLWNRAMESLSGLPRRDVLGKRDDEIAPQAEAARQRRIDQFVLNGRQTLDVPEEEVQPGGRLFPAHTVRVPIAAQDGSGLLLGLVEDITEVKEREALIRMQQAQLIHSSKMSTLGEMSGGVAHEINNPLTVIMGSAQRLTSLLDDPRFDMQEIAQCGGRIMRMTERIARIVRGLRTFAREASGDPFEQIALSQLVADTLELCEQRFLAHGIRLDVLPIAAGLKLQCRAVQVSQVLLNLLNNAFDAVRHLDEKWTRIEVEVGSGKVRLIVTDSGRGIAPEVAEKILHPFFTTKAVGEGTGLGLSIARGIVESHGGRLFYDAQGPNTRFVVELPRTQARSQAA